MDKPSRKSRVFVGSSVESLHYAYAVQENLDPYDADVKVWPQGVFQISKYSLESLLETLKVHDFGVFVFAADDVVTIRDRQQSSVRDNVIFELGLFMGDLGRERTFVFAPLGVDLRLPTDLLGWNIAYYDPERENHIAALGVACNKVRRAIRQLGNLRDQPPSSDVLSPALPLETAPTFAYIETIDIRKETVLKDELPGNGNPQDPETPLSGEETADEL
jgi:predicted nucleotide-binding protein